jgi:glycosyltransferase involved in cell wall biosynthesis
LKILHLSHGTLPDWRIEKCALSASRKLGFETLFAGLGPIKLQKDSHVFDKIYKIGWTEGTKLGILPNWNSTKKQVKNILSVSKPDIVHAHNIIAAKMISGMGVPFVFDDHEYTSVYVRGIAEPVKAHHSKRIMRKPNSQFVRNQIRKFAWNAFLKHRAIGLWTRWERDLISSAVPTIVTTERVSKDLQSRYSNSNSKRIFVVPNFPAESETQSLMRPEYHDSLSSAYAGVDGFYSAGLRAHRNLEGLTDLFIDHDIGDLVMIGLNSNSVFSPKIKYMEFLPRHSMYIEMFRHSIGLMAFRRHWSHQFKSPNKAYEYAHAGLYVMCTSSFSSVIESFKGHCGVFENYDELAAQLECFRDNLEELYKARLKSFEYAKKNLTWEKYEENIFRAYQLA